MTTTLAHVNARDGIAPDTSPTPANYVETSRGDSAERILAKAALVRPTARQATWQLEQLTAFIHFGVNTFLDKEWGDGTEDPICFDSTEDVDADAWVRELRDAGCRTAILTLKHHDGFMLWPSRYGDHTVAASPWRGGAGDVAAEFVAAARRHGMKVGFYVSPADSHAELLGVYGNGSARSPRTIPTLVPGDDRAGRELPAFTYDATDYGAFFLNTLYEVLTQYGEVSEVWFDGAMGNTEATEVFDYDAYHDLVARLQPGANIAVGGRDIRWIGNEDGIARRDEWSVIAVTDRGPGLITPVEQDGPFSEDLGSDAQLVAAVRSGRANRLHWWPAEADMRLTPGWFAHDDDVPKSGGQLLRHYEETVGRNAVMLLNVPPTRTGRFAPESVEALRDFAAERRRAFTADHASGLAFGDASPYVLDLGAERAISRIGVSEDILAAGMAIRSFTVETEIGDAWHHVATSGVVGSLRIIRLDEPVTARRWRITVTDARGPHVISAVHLWEQLAQDPGAR